ncbi:MAG: low molecular weight protein arginine phosphatase [Anaerolineae bacterium]
MCTANRCRSPMAEGLISSRATATGAPVEVLSAGTWAVDGVPATENARIVMAERGIDIEGHVSREVDAGLVVMADLILVMTQGHKEALEADFPAAAGKTLLMSALAGGRWDVADPVEGDLDEYRATADALAQLVASGWARIVGTE